MSSPILTHPTKRIELCALGQKHFNEEDWATARELWERLSGLENGRDRDFAMGLARVAAHFERLRHGAWAEAADEAARARKLLALPPAGPAYRGLDIAPLLSAMDYNVNLIRIRRSGWDQPPPPPEAFLVPKLL